MQGTGITSVIEGRQGLMLHAKFSDVFPYGSVIMAVHHRSVGNLYAAVESIPDIMNRDQALVRRGRFIHVDLMLEIGTQPFFITVNEGAVAPVERGPMLMRSWQFAVRGDESGWREFRRATPSPGFHDIFAMEKFGRFRIEGNLTPLMTDLMYFKGLLASPRRLAEML